jgi:MFS family permease
LGDAILPMAFAVHVIRSEHGISTLGMIFAARGTAMVLVMFIGGILADRIPKIVIMRTADVARIVLLIWLCTIISTSSVSMLIIISFIFGAFEALFRPAFRSIVPLLVDENGLKEANALISISNKTTGVFGPIIAGAIVASTSIQIALIIDAFTFLISFLLLGRGNFTDTFTSNSDSVSIEVRNTFRFLRTKPWIASQLIGGLVQMPLAVAPWFVLLPAISAEHFGSTAAYGFLLSFYALGGVAGAMIASKWEPKNRGVVAMGSVSLFSLPLLSLAFNAPFYLVLAAHLIAGCGLEIYAVYWYTALQSSVEQDYLGKILSLDMTAGALLMPVAYALSGPYIDQLGQKIVLTIGVAACLITTFPLLSIPANRRFSDK